MYSSSDEFTDNVFLSYDKILDRLNLLGLKTKSGEKIQMDDLRQAVKIMLKKHPTCRWQSIRVDSKRHFIINEGFLWLAFVYFQNDKKQIDADIYFFEKRISEYEKTLNLEPKNLFTENISVDDLELFFNRAKPTIKKAILKMIKVNSNYRYMENNKYIISSQGIEWLCKNCFKQKYLQLLEKYKMDLTQKYIDAGYLYDYFFGLN